MIIAALLALVVMTTLVTIHVCKKILRKQQNQFQEEDFYSVVGPPLLPERIANMPRQQNANPTKYIEAKNPAYGMNIMAMSDQGIRKSACDQRDSNAEYRDTMQLSSNTAYGTNVAIAPEIDCEVNLAYELEYDVIT